MSAETSALYRLQRERHEAETLTLQVECGKLGHVFKHEFFSIAGSGRSCAICQELERDA